MEHDDTITIITGKLIEICVDHIINAYAKVKHKLVSTWKNEDASSLELLSQNGFIIILNDLPEHKNTGNYQITCIRSGLLKARELGFKYAVRSRFDIFPNNQLKFINLIRHLYIEKITMITVIRGIPPNDDCILDLIVIGQINELLIFYPKLQEPTDTRVIEQFLMETYLNRTNIKMDTLNKHLNFCLNLCQENKIEFMWYRVLRYNRLYNTTGLSFPFMKLIGEFCKPPFVCAF